MSSEEENAACCDDSNKWEFEDSDFLQNSDPCVAIGASQAILKRGKSGTCN
jgi:hypothetical protein